MIHENNAVTFRTEIQMGAGPATNLLIRTITQTPETDPPVESDPATFLTLSFRQDLSANEREIFREAVLEAFNAYASGAIHLAPDQFDTLAYVAAMSSTPRRRRTELALLLQSCLSRARADHDDRTVQSILNLIADESLITNVREWQELYRQLGRFVGFQCFYGIGRIDLESALTWLAENWEDVDYELIHDFGFPALIKFWIAVDPTFTLQAPQAKRGSHEIYRHFADTIERITGISMIGRYATERSESSHEPLFAGDVASAGVARHRLTLVRNAEEADALPGDAAFYPSGLSSIIGA